MNHGMFEVEWTSKGHLVQLPLLKKGHLKLVTQDQVIYLLCVLKEGDFSTSLGRLCWCLLTITIKMCFPTRE